MRNPYDVLRSKEQELVRVKKEVEALRITARLLGVEEPAPTISLAKGDARQVVEMPQPEPLHGPMTPRHAPRFFFASNMAAANG